MLDNSLVSFIQECSLYLEGVIVLWMMNLSKNQKVKIVDVAILVCLYDSSSREDFPSLPNMMSR